MPNLVRLQLDTALFGDHSPHGSPGPEGAPRSKKLTVLVGMVRVRTTRGGCTQRVSADPGTVQYSYERSINEVFASTTGVTYENLFQITMPDAVLARCGDLPVDGQGEALPRVTRWAARRGSAGRYQGDPDRGADRSA